MKITLKDLINKSHVYYKLSEVMEEIFIFFEAIVEVTTYCEDLLYLGYNLFLHY